MPTITTKASVDASPGIRVLRILREMIADGTFAAGERLPSERDLAERFGVARTTVRDSIVKITAEGLVRSNGGRLRIVSRGNHGREHSSEAGAQPTLLRSTLLLLSNNPGGVPPGKKAHGSHGSADWIDQGVMEATHTAGFHYLAFNPKTPLDGAEWRDLIAAKPMGVIVTDVMRGAEEAHRELAALRRIGMVGIAYGDNPECQQFDRVASDHETGAYLVTRWLIDHGAKRILQLAPEDSDIYWFLGRRAGYERAVNEAGLPVIPFLPIPALPPHESGDRANRIDYLDRSRRYSAGYLMDAPGFRAGDPPVDAIMAVSDPNLSIIAGACRMLGRIVGQDLLLAGYDNTWRDFDVELELEPRGRPAVTVDKSNYAMGAALVALLQDRLSGRLPEEPQLRLIEPQLVVSGEAGNVGREVSIVIDSDHQGETK